MKRIAAACFVIVLLVLLSGCAETTPDDLDRIGRPSNNAVILEGTWEIEACIGSDTTANGQTVSANPVIGEKMGFSRQSMFFSDNIWNNVGYKVKRVNMKEYFLHKNLDALNSLEVDGEETLVITAYSQDKFLYEFVLISDDTMVVNIDEQYYRLKKTSEEYNGPESALKGSLKHPAADKLEPKYEPVRSGLLLGIRTPVKTEDGIGDNIYRTYWISGVNSIFQPVLSAKDIYLPRMDGFWKLKVLKRMGDEGAEDVLSASMVSKKGGKEMILAAENYSKRVETKLRSAVVYVGNDYVCVENTIFNNGKNAASPVLQKNLRTLPVDNLYNQDGIKISDLVGENGTMALDSAVADLLKSSGYSGIEVVDEASLQESFALYRKTGHWFFKGRLNLNPSSQLSYMDFSLNLIPPANMVAYDVLQVPWTEIKDKVPQAIDVYTSPNKDIAVVITRNSILLYSIEGKTLSKQPQVKLPLAEGSSVIMAEWALGDYVRSWEKSFIKNNETILVEAAK